MENVWIAAAAGTQGQSEVTAEPIGKDQHAITAVDSNAQAAPQAAPRAQSPYSMLIFVVAILIMMYFIMFREPKKRQKQHQQMVQSLKKNDRVRTIGGIFGTVVDIKDDEITLKVDEANNTKIKVAASAIGKNLMNEEK
jgi:preprotein translocase subunit YajC